MAATSILDGAFTDMLTGQAPFILFKLNRVLYWEDADQRMDFTSVDDTAAFTAVVALDPSTPRLLRIAGEQLSARELAAVAREVTGEKFQLLRAGGLGRLETLISRLAGPSSCARHVRPGHSALLSTRPSFTPWANT